MGDITTRCSNCGNQANVRIVQVSVEPAEDGASRYGICAFRIYRGTEHCPVCGHSTTTPYEVKREPLSPEDVNPTKK